MAYYAELRILLRFAGHRQARGGGIGGGISTRDIHDTKIPRLNIQDRLEFYSKHRPHCALGCTRTCCCKGIGASFCGFAVRTQPDPTEGCVTRYHVVGAVAIIILSVVFILVCAVVAVVGCCSSRPS